MKRYIFICGWLAFGCRPEVGDPASLIQGPTILAVKGEPAEAPPGTKVTLKILAVDREGTLPRAGHAPVEWVVCGEPKPPIENNSVSDGCLDVDYWLAEVGPTPTTYAFEVPPDACSLFGPIPPQSLPGEPSIRPRDPDVTGGYYLPIRASLQVAEEARREGMATVDSIMGFALERIACGIANVPSGPAREFNGNYVHNRNPSIATIAVWAAGTESVVFPPQAPRALATVGQAVELRVGWEASSVETYPAFDVVSRTLKYRREAIRVSWFGTDGIFDHDITGRGEDDPTIATVNTFTPRSTGTVHLWIVLRDSRGGTDFQGFEIDVR